MALHMRNVAALFVISLAVAVISLSTDAGAALAPSITVRPMWVPVPGFGHVVGKMATDASGTIYVADYSQKAIVKLNGSGQYVGRISTAAIGAPYGVALLKNGNIVVTFQSPVSRAVMFDTAGTVISNGTDLGNATFQHVTAVVVDGLDNIYILDGGSLKGEVYLDGNYNYQLAGSYPSIHVFRKNGAKYLTTPYIGPRPAGYADNSFGTISRLHPLQATDDKGFGMLGAEGMIYDPVNKRILVADTTNGRVIAFSSAEAAQPFVQLSKPGNPAVPLQWGTSYISSPGNDPIDGHMAAPTGLALELSAGRLYVVDKTLARIKVFDYETGTMIKLIEPSQNGFRLTMPRDIMLYKGNLLISSEEGQTQPNLVTLSVDTAQWPPASVQITLDPFPPNIVKQAGDIYRFTGKVETGSTVGWTNAVFSGGCVIPNPLGYGLENFYCDVTMDTTGGTNGTYQNIIFTATKNGNSSSVGAVPAPNYTTAASLRSAPVVTSAPPVSEYTNITSATLTGTIDISATGATTGAMVKLVNAHDGALYYATIDLNSPGNAKPWSAQVLLEEGVNTFTITGWAEMTDTGSASPQTVTLDTQNPSITLGFLQDGSTTTRQVLNVNGILVEQNLKSASVLVNGISQYQTLQIDPRNGYFSVVVELTKNGSNTVSVVAEDLAGNQASVSSTVSLDPMKAGPVTMTTPSADNIFLTVPQSSMDFACTADPSTTNVKFGGDEIATLAGSTWSATTMRYIPAQGILRTVSVEATGPYGKLHDYRSFFLDATSPAVQITEPATDIPVKSAAPIPFAGSFDVAYSDGSPVTSITAELFDSTGNLLGTPSVTRNDVTKTFSGTADLSGKPDGRYAIRVTVKNQNNATTVAVRNLLLDTKPPVIGVCVDPSNGDTLYGALDAGSTIANSASRPMVLSGHIWSMNRSGLNSFSLTATDSAGNVTTVGMPAPNPYDGDMDGDGIVRVYDAVIALRAIANNTASPAQIAHGDVSTLGYVVAGFSCPDGALTLEDVQLILAKASGKAWQ